jgi:DNA-directed RNA polymerase specialized sigma24 family protein
MSSAEPDRAPPIFPTTDWSLVAHCRDPATHQPDYLGHVLAIYLPALRTYLRRVKRLSAEDADEIVQEFAASRLLGDSIIRRAHPEQGRFRTFLLTVFQNHVADQHRRHDARRRGHERYALLRDASPPPASADPFDIEWARSVLNETARRMRQHLLDTGRSTMWALFESRVLVPTLQGSAPPAYEQMVREYGFQTPTQVCSAVVTTRRMFGRLLREVVGEYTEDPEQIEDELNDLWRITGGAR